MENHILRKGVIFRSLNKQMEMTEEPVCSWIFWIFGICLEVCTHVHTQTWRVPLPHVPWREHGDAALGNGWGSKSSGGMAGSSSRSLF